MKIKRADDVFSKKIGGSWVILMSDSGYIQQLNEVASDIWELCSNAVDMQVIVKKICKTYQGDALEIEKDVREFVAECMEQKFLVEL